LTVAKKPGDFGIDFDDPQVIAQATVRDLDFIDALRTCGGSAATAAKRLKIGRSAICNAMQRLRKRLEAHSYAPEHGLTHSTSPMRIAKGVSTLYDGDGQIRLQWVKDQLDTEQWEQIKRAAVEALAIELPKYKPVPWRGVSTPDLMTQYTLTDSHVGMLAWGRETGEPWDLKIAEDVLVGCFEQMIIAAPPAKYGFLCQLGDFLHQDGFAAVTPASGHNLDSDGRFEKIVEVALRILRRVITMMLHKHESVAVLLAEGNHDPVSSSWLRVLFKALFENEPRVRVIQSPLPYYCIQFGETMVGAHHGHLKANAGLPLLFAAQFPKEWGATTKRYIHTGHWHHVDEKEHNGVTVIQHPTLAARDAYAARMGYVALRQVTAITYHQSFGKVRTDTIVPEMLEGVPA
jgi:hypothetical protein